MRNDAILERRIAVSTPRSSGSGLRRVTSSDFICFMPRIGSTGSAETRSRSALWRLWAPWRVWPRRLRSSGIEARRFRLWYGPSPKACSSQCGFSSQRRGGCERPLTVMRNSSWPPSTNSNRRIGKPLARRLHAESSLKRYSLAVAPKIPVRMPQRPRAVDLILRSSFASGAITFFARI